MTEFEKGIQAVIDFLIAEEQSEIASIVKREMLND